MLALLQAPTNHVPGWLQITVAVLAALQSLSIVGGIIAAAYRFRREKPHKGRFQPTISGVAATKDKIIHLQVEVSAENVGQVPISLEKSATILRVTSRKTGDSAWTPQWLENVLGQQDEIQPGETLIDQQWFEKPEEGKLLSSWNCLWQKMKKTYRWLLRLSICSRTAIMATQESEKADRVG